MSLPIELAADVTLNVRNVNKTQRDIEKAVGTGATKGLSGAIKTTQREMRTAYSKAYEDALRIGHKEDAALLKEKWKSNLGYMRTANAQVKRLNQQIAKEQDKDVKKRLKAQRKGIESNLKLEQAGMRGLISERASAQEHQLKLLDEGMEKAARSFSEKTEGAAENFTDIVNKGLTLDSLDPADLMKSLAGGLKNAAPSMMSGGKAAVAKGGGMGGIAGKAMAGLGKAAMALSGAAAAIASVVAVIAVFAVVAAAAYGQTKKWNKAIMEGVSGFDAYNAGGKDVSKTLGDIRTAASRVSRAWSTAGEEIIASMNAFHQQGLTIGEMKAFTGAARQVDAYAQVMTFAQVQTRALGMETGELATITNRMYEQYGYGLKEMSEQMAHFGGAALLAGMNTRSFVAAVMEAGANMALYNFRLEDTSDLLIGLTKILGEDLAKQTLGMEGTFRNMGTEGRYKASLTGGKALGGVIDAGATRQLEGAFSDMTATQLGIMREAGILGMGAGIGDNEVTIADIDLEKLGGLSGIESGALMNKMSDAGSNMTGFESLTDLAAGIGGTHLQRADALDELDRSGEIAASVAQAMGVLKFQDFESMGAGGQMAMENMTGLQGEQLRVVESIFNRVGASMAADAEPGTYGAAGPGYAEIAAAISGGDHLTKEMKDQLAEMEGPAIDVATQQLQELQTLGDVLSTNIAGLLNWIGGGVATLTDGFLKWFGAGSSKKDKALTASSDAERGISSEISDLTTELRTLERDASKSEAQKVSARDRISADLDRAETALEAEQNFQQDLRSGAGVDDANVGKLQDLYGDDLVGMIRQETQTARANSRLDVTDPEYQDYSESAIHGIMGSSDVEQTRAGRRTDEEILNTIDGGEVGALEQLLAATVAQGSQAREEAATAAEISNDELASSQEAESIALEQVEAAMLAEAAGEATADEVSGLAADYQEGVTTSNNLLKANLEANDMAALAAVLTDTEMTAMLAQVGQVGGGYQANWGSKLRDRGVGGAEGRVRARATGQDVDYTTINASERVHGSSGVRTNPKGTAQDFLYTGDANGGMITHIDDKDSFFGAKPGGAIDSLGGGHSIVISNLTINESGNPQKTLQMVKQALRAAQQA